MPIIRIFENQNKISFWWSYRDFYDKKSLKADSNHTCLTVIRLVSDLNKDVHSTLKYKKLYIKLCLQCIKIQKIIHETIFKISCR